MALYSGMQASLFDSCKGYIQALASRPFSQHIKAQPAITISRETGAGAMTIGKLLVKILEDRHHGSLPWTFFDRELVERVIQDHALPERLKRYMPEDKGNIHTMIEEVFGLHPDPRSLVEHTADTILRLATLGNAIMVGRGGNIVTSRLPNVLHVRLVAPMETRIRRIRKLRNLTEREAVLYIETADMGRRRYVKHYFNEDIADPLHYHLVVNTGMVPDERAAMLIADAAEHLVQ
ncbi:MAG TPA: cytidylate kinase-like family protein [Chthoniobacteraceae bacterium]|nr:cytidylate kinase-like family protein [Chthoniobacteraceae bacterium]